MLNEQEVKRMSEEEFLIIYSEIDNKGSRLIFNALGLLLLVATLFISGIFWGNIWVYFAFITLGLSVICYKKGIVCKKKAVALWLAKYPK
ncbi:hypothetical protein [Acinetobacter haemolyticus]|uniref:Uncharacterized protein n=2 Tax=Acinetobacter haemolyticus TaxID=29430 RepID=A0AAJ3DA70_ACIHA|nr:hypothetical protein [Acinetobacter haemolyticus]ATZ68209.1 hypothetical protein BSR56_13200 [Acinetobacter haemolyticus]NAR37367.1 hypothetical protein [Acinetobacter haemolyticus]NAR48617.1 hypothetical protein [Acinetobacter haemolyticus]NAR73753.1 hypothetical protein [Acinetobacter haemolyticus]RSN78459.1 hypothetical protein EA769_01350 [Acinetobacter haemolyticus]